MNMTRFLVIAGLVLTLATFSPAMAQTSGNTNPATGNTNSDSTTTVTNASGTSSMSPASNSQSDNESASEAQDINKGLSKESQDLNKDLTPGEANATTPSSAMPSSMSMAEQESNIGRQIHRLDRDLSDAESFEANGREEWGKGDNIGAQRDFRIAQHILRMATGGKSYQPTFVGENPLQQQAMVENAIAQARKNGGNTGDAQHYLDKGKDALNRGDQNQASHDFRSAELALGIPVEVGYAEIWEAEVPGAEQQNAAAGPQSESSQAAMARPRTKSEVQSDIDSAASQGKDVSEAQAFLKEGEQALNDGDQNKAQRDFRAAERAISMNEAYNASGASNRASDDSD